MPIQLITSTARGVPSSWLAGVLADWLEFDFGEFGRRVAELSQVQAELDDQLVQVVHVAGRGPDPLP